MNIGMTIVFNGEPTVKPCLLNAAKVLDKLIVVEGATIRNSGLSDDGHSTDRTVEILHELKHELGDRLNVITTSGYWADKLEMCRAAEPYFEDGWLWEIDADEFYHADAMRLLIEELKKIPADDVEFWAYHFFGGTGWHMPVKEGVWGNKPPWRRVFKVHPGDEWESHTPPRIKRNQASVITLSRNLARKMGIMLYHYGYISRPHVVQKMIQHDADPYIMRQFEKAMRGEYTEVDIDGYHLERFTGKHPVNVEDFGI